MRTTQRIALALAATAALLATTASAERLPPPPVSGYQVLWHFPGIRTDSSPVVAGAVHCTNLGSRESSVLVEAFRHTAALAGYDLETVEPGETVTFGIGDLTAFYAEQGLVAFIGDLVQGLVRVSAKGERRIVCQAQVLDAQGTVPSFIVDVPAFDKNGKR